MPIEKLEIKLMKDVSGVLENLPIYPCNEKVIHKLNELIDAINNDGYYLAQPHHISVEIKDIKERLKVLENATQPKEEESPLPCPWCSQLPEVEQLHDRDGFISWSVSCENSKCSYNPMNDHLESTKQEAITAWNDRKKE